MFGSQTKTRAPEPSVIGKGTLIEGTVRVFGPVQVDGRIDGGLIAEGPVSIGPHGSVFGDVVAEELVVGGRVEGRVNVRGHLHVAENGSARGELRYGSLQVDRGGVIAGNALHDEVSTTADPEPLSPSLSLSNDKSVPVKTPPPLPPPPPRSATVTG